MVLQLTTQLSQNLVTLEKHLKKMVKFIEDKTDIEILAIGIGTMFQDIVIDNKITDVNELEML